MKRVMIILTILSAYFCVSFAQSEEFEPRQPHYSGYNCSNCHSFEFGGTVYTDASGGSPVSGVQVQITGSNGSTANFTTNSYGNFWTSSSSPTPPYTTSISYNGNTISMVSSFSDGSCNGCHSNGSRIYVPPTQSPPTSNFTGNPTSGDVPLLVNFTDQSSQGSSAITSWSWNFGDGGSSSIQNPTHTYNSVGTFSVTLMVTDASGLSDSFTRTSYITVNQAQFAPPTAEFSANPITGNAPLSVSFVDLSTPGDGAITNWNWSFGDGGSSSIQNPTHTYNLAGTFNVSLTVTDSNGLSDTFNQTNLITVNGEPTPGEYVLIAWSKGGMHCMNSNFDNFMILPPANTIQAQLIYKTDNQFPDIVTDGYRIEYSIPGNTYSVGKTNFWDFASDIFGTMIPENIGLTGNGMTGEMEISDNYFLASAIPITPFTDSDWNTLDPYQLIHLEAYSNATGELVASSDVTIPVSTEMHCVDCHGSETNILFDHEDEFDPNNTPIVCGNCHAQNPLGFPGIPEALSFSYQMHKKHASEVGPENSISSCYKCHPGPETQCLRGTMNEDFGMVCQDCHGTMNDVWQSIENGREPWVDEPTCGECHGENYAEEPNTLYQASKGHGDMFCSACHGSTHAIYPTREANDNLQSIALQGHAGTISECTVCHSSVPGGAGPHGSDNPPDSPPPPTNLTAVGEVGDYDMDGIFDNAIKWSWNHQDYTTSVDCNGDEIPGWWIDEFVGDGNCDVLFDCEGFDFDGGDCSDFENCGTSLVITNTGDYDDDGEENGPCWSDNSAYFYFSWEGGCLATTLYYSGAQDGMDLTSYGFTDGFYFYGFDNDVTEDFTLDFDDGSSANQTATSGICDATECAEGYIQDCVDEDCIIENWIGDGYCDGISQEWGADLCCYDLDGGDCTEEECADDDRSIGESSKFISASKLDSQTVSKLSKVNRNRTLNNRYDYVTFEISVTWDGGGNTWVTSGTEFLVYGFEQGEIGCASVVAVGNDGTVSESTPEICASAGDPAGETEISIDMSDGWNWFSVNVEAEDMSLDAVLLSLGSDATLIKNQTGFATYYDDFGWYGLDFIDVTSMYMIFLENSSELVFAGTAVDYENTPISLSEGWNWIGYLPQASNNLDEALDSIGESASMIKSQTAFATYYEGFGWYGMDSLDPGVGYMLMMSESAELIYSSPTTLIKNVAEFTELYWTVNPHQYENNMTMTAYFNEIGKSDVLAAFVGDEIRGVTGATYFPPIGAHTFNLMIYGNPGEEIRFVVYQSYKDVEVDIEENITFVNNGNLGNDFEPVMLKVKVIPIAYNLSQNYPNPFNPTTTIEYDLPQETFITIDIYNVMGQRIDVLLNSNQVEGCHKVVWNADSYPSGIYFVRMVTETFEMSRKMLLVK